MRTFTSPIQPHRGFDVFDNPVVLTNIRVILNAAGIVVASGYILAVLYYVMRVPQFRFYSWGLLIWLIHIVVFQSWIAIFNPPPGPVTALWSVVLRLHGSISFGTYAVLMYRYADRKYNG